MATKDLPSPEVLRQLLRYEPETGKMYWLPRPSGMFSDPMAAKRWNARYAEREAFTSIDVRGYVQAGILGHRLAAHRVIWAFVTGAWPSDEVDHINHVKSDNRLTNLRAATRAQNQHNRKPRKSSANLKGVSLHRRSGLWRARISVNKTELCLGYFKTPSLAHEAYCAASKSLHGDFSRTS